MKKKLIGFLLCAAMFFSLVNFNTKRTQAASSSMTVNVDKEKITINLKNIVEAGTVYGYKANSYFSDDENAGISTKNSADYTVGTYTPDGNNQAITVNRYDEDGNDRLYDKYYLISDDDEVIKGPIYATSITPLYDAKTSFTQNSKKGIYNENSTNMKYVKDLGASSMTVIIDLGNLMYVDKDDAPSNAIEYKVNGTTYYFNPLTVSNYDSLISTATAEKKNVEAIIIAYKASGYETYPSALRYNSSIGSTLLGTNTATTKGLAYYTAMMDFLANRYSQDEEHGFISNYIIGNEVDFTPYFYNCKDFNTFMVEYERSLRIANLAVKKYTKYAKVAISLTHYWNGDSEKLGKETKGYTYRPYKMLNWLASYTNKQGAYDWALAPHCYASYNAAANILLSDTKRNWTRSSYKTAKQITFTNLEVLQSYLSKSSMKYNGKMRSVYLTESGLSSHSNTKSQLRLQAASLAYAYMKVANLSCIKTFDYYRLKDNKKEVKKGLSCGLLTSTGKKKLAYTIYKNIDNYSWRKTANTYLKKMKFYKNGNKKKLYSYANGKINSYMDLMRVYTSYKGSYSYRNMLKTSLKKNDPGIIYSLKGYGVRRGVHVSWKKASYATGYRIKVNGKVVKTTKSRSATIKRLSRYKKYTVTVQGYKTVNGTKHYGFTTTVTVKSR